MPDTLSGHEAITSPADRRLAVGKVPGRPITFRTRAAYLPLFLRLGVLLDQVIQLHRDDSWSYAYRQARMGSGVSDHAGYAVDVWTSREGATGWPTRMTAAQAKQIARILETFQTSDGRHVFGWGAVSAGGYTGPHYTRTANSDPMHFYIAPGITVRDAVNVRRRMGIRTDGTVARLRAA